MKKLSKTMACGTKGNARRGGGTLDFVSEDDEDFDHNIKKSEILKIGKPCTHLFEVKTEQNLKENGKLRVEGKSYVVADEDVLHFRFNV